ncbi:MAG TPA: bifunctional riboflavin kinase/FAD synthetase [Cryomorphaceae bacterium]|nr:bifunctional riboflavin kinase/FAD synthetase [Cryomorphaceae bacterium]
MKLYHNLSEFNPTIKAIVTVGTFDGVHIGHQELLSRIRELAQKEGGETVLLTFSPHPRIVLFPDDNDLKLLTTMEERIDRLEKSGLDHLIIHPFSVAFSRITALEYVRDVLVNQIGVHKLVIGYDHHFGRNREGNLSRLKEMAPSYGFDVEEISAREIDDVNVSSTKIRNALESGEIELANEYLGYAYSVTGDVVEGDKIGRSMGFPTANLKPLEATKMIPETGVYATIAVLNGTRYNSMTNIGYRPTVSAKGKPRIEVHIFDFEGDIYRSTLTIEFEKRLRSEQKFENLAALKNQLEIDAEHTRNFFAAGGAGIDT